MIAIFCNQNMNWQEFIKKLSRDFRLSEAEIADKSGITYPTINRIGRGITKIPNQNTIKKIEEGLNISIDDSDPENVAYKLLKDSLQLKKFEGALAVYEYPLLSEVYAGEPDKVDIEYSGVHEPFTYYKKNHSCFALRVNGQSMETTLNDGDLVLVDMNLIPFDGDLVAVKLKNGHQYIKRFKNLNFTFVQLSSDNSEYGVRLIDKNDIEAIYPVVQIVLNIRNGERKQ